MSVLEEARQLSAAAVRRARGIDWIKPPVHLVYLVPHVRREHGSALQQVHRTIDQRLADRPGAVVGAFYAASELALIAEIWRSELTPGDRASLRACWSDLLAA